MYVYIYICVHIYSYTYIYIYINMVGVHLILARSVHPLVMRARPLHGFRLKPRQLHHLPPPHALKSSFSTNRLFQLP